MIQKKHFILLMLMLPTLLFAQTRLELANRDYDNKNYYEAVQKYKKILKKPKATEPVGEIQFKTAESLRHMHNYEGASEFYSNAINNAYEDPKAIFQLGHMLLRLGQYDKSLEQLDKYLRLQPGDLDALRLMESNKFALINTNHQSPYTIQNESVLNSGFSDYGAVFFHENKAIFSSSRKDKGDDRLYLYDGQGFSNFYESEYDHQYKRWEKPVKVKSLSSRYNDGTFTYDNRTRTGYYMQCNGISGKKDYCTILQAQYDEETKKWSEPQQISFADAAYSVGHPTISSNGNTFYFVSDMPGGFGGKDLWMVKKDGESWGQPENLGAAINTPQDEMFPHIRKDSLLYFSSDGHVGMGGLDIFYSVQRYGEWQKPVNMKPPFNSSADDFSMAFHQTRNDGFFTSNRQGGQGQDDIYAFFTTPVFLSVTGLVTDVETKEPLAGVMVVLSSTGISDTIYTNKDGVYTSPLAREMDYKLHVQYKGFFGDSRSLSTIGETSTREFSKEKGANYDFSLMRIPKEEIDISDIYYDFNKWTLRNESKASLDKLVKLLQDSPDIAVVINAHTDEIGAVAYNQTLSEKRAQSVVDYLIANGVNPIRLSSKGYGKSQPKVRNAKSDHEHQLNRRTTFLVTNLEF